MSRLSEMIREMCPDGVEYRKLGEIAYYVKERIKVSDVDACNYVGVEHLCQNTEGREISVTLPDADFVIAFRPEDILIGNIRPYLKKAWLADCHGGTNGDVLTIRIDDKRNVSPQYLFYILSSERFFMYDMKYAKGAKMPRGDKKAVMNYELPVPPLLIQNEIVKLLDNFTELTAELTTELTAELLLREKQYNFYRDSLLNFDQNDRDVEWKTIGMIGDVTKLAGFEFTKYVTYVETGKIIALRGLNVKGKLDLTDVKYLDGSDLTKLERSKLYKDDILFTYVGTVGQVALIDCDDKYYLAPNVARIRFDKEVVDPAYIRYFFQTEYFMRKQIEKYAKTSSMKNLTMENIRKFQVPIPPLETQAKIVSILDRFDELCHDLTQGLPAEIAARKKQYEYYREKLLTFPRKGTSARRAR